MNYRHAYHAGNFADVVKHLLLMLVLEHLSAKDKPFSVIDTHAGIGLYDLAGAEAGKTGEWQSGIGRLLAHQSPLPPALARFAALVRSINAPGALRFYPGSPAIIRALMRPEDRAWLCELHPADAEALRRTMASDRRIRVGAVDGYQALATLLPPTPRRGLVLIDPPFEKRDEFDRLAAASIAAAQRWPQGIQMLWYPIKDRNEAWKLHERLEQANLPALLEVEFMRDATPDVRRFNGTGLVVVNAPWRLDETLNAVLPDLLTALGAAEAGATKAGWIVPPV